jgi:hypothetical protein
MGLKMFEGFDGYADRDKITGNTVPINKIYANQGGTTGSATYAYTAVTTYDGERALYSPAGTDAYGILRNYGVMCSCPTLISDLAGEEIIFGVDFKFCNYGSKIVIGTDLDDGFIYIKRETISEVASLSCYLNDTLIGSFEDVYTTNLVANKFEIHVKLNSSTAGFVKVRVNTTQHLEVTGLDTSCTGYVSIKPGIKFCNNSNCGLEYIKAMYVIDPLDGVEPTAWIGNFDVVYLPVLANGTYQDFTSPSGVAIDNVGGTVDDSSTYIQSSAVDNISTFTLDVSGDNETAITNGTVVGIRPRISFLGGYEPHNIKGVVRIGSTDYDVGNEVLCTANVGIDAPSSRILALNPNTGLAWTLTDLQALEVGVKQTT